MFAGSAFNIYNGHQRGEISQTKIIAKKHSALWIVLQRSTVNLGVRCGITKMLMANGKLLGSLD